MQYCAYRQCPCYIAGCPTRALRLTCQLTLPWSGAELRPGRVPHSRVRVGVRSAEAGATNDPNHVTVRPKVKKKMKFIGTFSIYVHRADVIASTKAPWRHRIWRRVLLTVALCTQAQRTRASREIGI